MLMTSNKISTEEKWITYYFEELKEAGFIKEIEFQPEPLKLSKKIAYPLLKPFKRKSDQIIVKTLMREHIYTPDFKILWNYPNPFIITFTKLLNGTTEKLAPFICHNINLRNGYKITDKESYIEVKNVWDGNNMTRMFNHRTQPWIWQRYNIYVNLIKVPIIFKQTFIPNKILHEFYYKKNTKKNKKGDKKFSWSYKTLQNYLEIKN